MCVSDWRAGRFMKTVPRTFSVAAGTDVVIGSSQQRVAIRFCCALVSLGAGAAFNVTLDDNLIGQLVGENWELYYTLENDGDLPTRAFTIESLGAGPDPIVVVETFLTEVFLQKGTEQWQRELMR